MDDPDPDRRARIVEAKGKESVLAVEEDGKLAGEAGTIQGADTVGEDPGVARPDPRLGRWF